MRYTNVITHPRVAHTAAAHVDASCRRIPVNLTEADWLAIRLQHLEVKHSTLAEPWTHRALAEPCRLLTGVYSCLAEGLLAVPAIQLDHWGTIGVVQCCKLVVEPTAEGICVLLHSLQSVGKKHSTRLRAESTHRGKSCPKSAQATMQLQHDAIQETCSRLIDVPAQQAC
jgi:hypothetical protein